ncbi:MAG: hypothetical protein OHK0037_03350 [Elainellaceae cyanobacterium]
MKRGSIGIWIGLAIAAVGIGMAATNPGEAAYNEYATARLSDYLNREVCPNTDDILGIDLKDACTDLISENQDELRELISENTRRSNYGVLSLYQTNLSAHGLLPAEVRSFLPPQLLPAYQFKTAGLFGNFVTYEAKKQ